MPSWSAARPLPVGSCRIPSMITSGLVLLPHVPEPTLVVKLSGRLREPYFPAGPEMLLTAQRTPHPSPDLGQAVDAVRLDPRGNFTTRARHLTIKEVI